METSARKTESVLQEPEEPPPGAEVEELVRQGRERMRQFDIEGYMEAVTFLLQALARDPACAAAHAALAETYSYWGFRRELNGQESRSYYALSFEHAERALSQAPESSASHRAMSVALRRGERMDPERRRAEAQSAVELGPDDPENWYERWRAFGYDPSDDSIQRVLGREPGLCGAHVDLGAALCRAGRLQEALGHLLEAVRLRPGNTLASYDLAMVLNDLGYGDRAEAVLAKAKKVHPEDPLLERGYAMVHGEQDGRS